MHKSNPILATTYASTIAFLIIGFCTENANAYIDPGTGSLIIQSVIGAIAAVGVTLKLYWHKIKLLFSGRKPENSSVERTESED